MKISTQCLSKLFRAKLLNGGELIVESIWVKFNRNTGTTSTGYLRPNILLLGTEVTGHFVSLQFAIANPTVCQL